MSFDMYLPQFTLARLEFLNSTFPYSSDSVPTQHNGARKLPLLP